MSRLSYFGALLSLTALLSAPMQAQAGSPKTANSTPARVEHVVVQGAEAADSPVAVEIQTSGAPVEPDTQVITGPDRIVVDFPGAVPAAELGALKVNRGALKGVRTGLFFSSPPITRVVLDLAEAQSYQVTSKATTAGNTIVVQLGPVKLGPAKANTAKADSAQKSSPHKSSVKPISVELGGFGLVSIERVPVKTSSIKLSTFAPSPAVAAAPQIPDATPVSTTKLAPPVPAPTSPAPTVPAPTAPVTTASLAAGPSLAAAKAASAASVATASPLLDPVADELTPPKPVVNVTFANQMLTIHAERATLAQVLFEVQRQTHADIAIPAGAEQEEVAADIGPAPARDVLAALLNGSPYNFIFVGNEESLERVILTRRDPNLF